MAAVTLDRQEGQLEGWLTVYKSRNPFMFSKQKPDKVLERAWCVFHSKTSKGPTISFFQDNRKEVRVLKRDKVDLLSVREITKIFGHPKHANCFTLKNKGKRNRFLFDCDSNIDLNNWLRTLSDALRLEFRLEKVIWEFLDETGLWQALSDRESYDIEAHYCDQHNQFLLGDREDKRVHYNLGQMQRLPPKLKHTQRLKRSPFIWERPEVLHQKMNDLPAIWEWGDPSNDEWHPFERDTNIQIEDMYDSGSQWAELILCMPSPMLLLLNLQDMKLVNSKTQVRYSLRRFDNTANMKQAPSIYGTDGVDPRSPSPDDDDKGFENVISPVSPLFQPLQNFLQHLQVPRKNINTRELLGEGAFGEVYLADATGLPGTQGTVEVAVKQLKLSDFIARHGQHSQQMEDFLREAKEMAKVDHHRVVKLIAVCTLDFPLLLIEEYMNQGDLLAVLKEGRPSMPLVQQLSFSWQVADGMNYLATDLQCVHRDLAARNVMVHKTESGEMLAKIADFGLSRHLYSEMYKHQGNKPRPLPAKWMALESLMYFIFTTKSDVWSFGVMLWEIMTLGRTPYPGVENRELLEQIEEHGLKLNKPKGCPQSIYDSILDCTQHEPDDRPTFGELKFKLYNLYEDVKEGRLQRPSDSDEETTPKTGAKELSNKPEEEGEKAGEKEGEEEGEGGKAEEKEGGGEKEEEEQENTQVPGVGERSSCPNEEEVPASLDRISLEEIKIEEDKGDTENEHEHVYYTIENDTSVIDTNTDVNTDTDLNADTNTDATVKTDVDASTNSDSKTGTDININTDTDTTDTNTDTDAKPDPNADTDTNTESNTEVLQPHNGNVS
ncbi:PREDICTED: tyrosine-protein kinase Abl-like [Amphimedon queenslandica]|uniref:Non-specific protein-tyrosine kinase n=1 Tax=Amphimedon queenslandica TaxID=400682 RepID=A0A1X7UAN7_AMPQE|nr:PREDICTED: tyrosine-protein kinase Abl-like [Amphimedon queenslandica]|eukprot:XP_019855382.1 PREDICTED: tyrosine-protein kinase Abl-like [Amphimedon queenslandica]